MHSVGAGATANAFGESGVSSDVVSGGSGLKVVIRDTFVNKVDADRSALRHFYDDSTSSSTSTPSLSSKGQPLILHRCAATDSATPVTVVSSVPSIGSANHWHGDCQPCDLFR